MSTLPARWEYLYEIITLLLGVVSLTYGYIIMATIILLFILFIVLRPKVHPGVVLKETQNGLMDMQDWINNETITAMDATRRMRWIRASSRGLDVMDSIEERVERLLAQHETDCTVHNAFRYVKSLPKLVREAHKCQADLTALRSNLEAEICTLKRDGGPREYSYPIPAAP